MNSLLQVALKSSAILLHPLVARRLRKEAGVGFSYRGQCEFTAQTQQDCYADRLHKPQANRPSSMQRPLSSLPPKPTPLNNRTGWQFGKQASKQAGLRRERPHISSRPELTRCNVCLQSWQQARKNAHLGTMIGMQGAT